MTLQTLTIPDDPAELPRWLEQRLMASDGHTRQLFFARTQRQHAGVLIRGGADLGATPIDLHIGLVEEAQAVA